MSDTINEQDKEYNPMLQFDAFTYGIEDGGLRSKDAIKIMICYILANNDRIKEEQIIKTMVEGEIANYFEVVDAISWLKSHKNITINEDESFSLSTQSKEAIELVEKDLPLTLRRKSIELSRKIVAKDIFIKENKVIVKEEDKGFSVEMHISDKADDFMELKLFVPTKVQAEVVKNMFLNNPIKVYENLINTIFEEN